MPSLETPTGALPQAEGGPRGQRVAAEPVARLQPADDPQGSRTHVLRSEAERLGDVRNRDVREQHAGHGQVFWDEPGGGGVHRVRMKRCHGRLAGGDATNETEKLLDRSSL